MRRSAAPSQQGPASKKGNFVPPFLSNKQPVRTGSPQLEERGTNNKKSEKIETPLPCTDVTRSTRDILHLIQSSASTDSELCGDQEPRLTPPQTSAGDFTQRPAVGNGSSSNGGLRQFQTRPQLFEAIGMPNSISGGTMSTAENAQPVTSLPRETNVISSDAETLSRYFSVMWCKVSKKKHKKWEGDAILVTKGRSVVLMDMEGKEIGRGCGYKLAELQTLTDGQMLVIGGKEIEVMGVLSEEQFKSGKCFQTTASTLPDDQSPLSGVSSSRPALHASKPFVKPFKNGDPSSSLHVKPKDENTVRPLFNPSAPNALVMPRPPDSHQWQYNLGSLPVVDVVVDPHVSVHLRPHQREGVIFLYQCVMGMKPFRGNGAILADEMGLGKTLQSIALVWTLLKQGPYGGRHTVKRVLVITPGSLVKNWFKEFRKWLSSERISVFAVSSHNTVEQFAKSPLYPVMIISYEMFIRNVDAIKKLNFDLLICDEGHRLKNANIKTTLFANSLSVNRRVVLTGTPIQNDLQELFAISDFCNPGILGTLTAFRRVYEDPILASRQPTASTEERTLGQNRASELNRVTSAFVLRRTQEINNEYLPPRIDIVLFCALSTLQVRLYRALLKSRAIFSCLHSADSAQHLRCISALKKLCNHSSLLQPAAAKTVSAVDGQDSQADLYRGILSLYPPDYQQAPTEEHSGKMNVLSALLSSFHLASATEKVVVVSSYTSTLDLIESHCKKCGYQLLRLDGQTPTARRSELVERFNSRHSPEFVFLLSTKAGGVGLNLIGASRLVLYDIDWNPANDLQAMARVWRDGQCRRTYVYRLLTTGTIEEKIYQRQVSKQGLTGAVVDARSTSCDDRVPTFDLEQLRALFSLDEDTLCATHDLLDCDCDDGGDGRRITERRKSMEASRDAVRDCQLSSRGAAGSKPKNTGMDELLEWKHCSGPSPDLSAVDPLVKPDGLTPVTFALWTESNSLHS